jgi:hypothetical protein
LIFLENVNASWLMTFSRLKTMTMVGFFQATHNATSDGSIFVKRGPKPGPFPKTHIWPDVLIGIKDNQMHIALQDLKECYF